METILTKVGVFNAICFFIYDTETLELIHVPTILDEATSITTTILTTHKEVERSNIEDLMIEFDFIGLLMPIDENAQIIPEEITPLNIEGNDIFV